MRKGKIHQQIVGKNNKKQKELNSLMIEYPSLN